MNKYLSELKGFLTSYKKQTDALLQLEARVDELLVEELMKECLLYRTEVEVVSSNEVKWIKYHVVQDDYEHITEYLHLVQGSLPDDILVGANHLQTAGYKSDKYTVLFKLKGKNK
jgi:hypothetical protein